MKKEMSSMGGKKNDRQMSSAAFRRQLIHADVTLRSQSGKSIHKKGVRLDSKSIREYFPPPGASEKVIKIVESMGFRIIAKGRITVNIAAPLEEFQKAFGVKLTTRRFCPYIAPKKQRVPDEEGCALEFLYEGGKQLPVPDNLKDLVEAIHLGTPALFCQSQDPPSPHYFHLKVPTDVARLVDAIQCHNRAVTGAGTTLVMPDQGTFNHPYYTARGYNITLDSSAYDGTADNGSHGTAIAANALAVAPGVHFIGVRNGKFVSSATAAFQQAAAYHPDVISISWGRTSDVPNLRAAIAEAIMDGTTVCCACGNGGDLVFPSSIPEVISVGGTYADEADQLQASTYASSGILAGVDPGRNMPDLTGFVGQAPNGIYITLPCHPNSEEDVIFADSTFPDGDETTDDDGWLVASGTSSATPQVAAVVCLLIQANPSLKWHPDLIKARLLETALDVTSGTSASGQNAAVGLDSATGAGAVDAYLAVNRVDIWVADNDNDRGLIPCKGAHWVSPDIKVLSSLLAHPEADFNSAAHIDRPVYGTQYYVYIKARNRGVDAASDVAVGFYYADPNTFNAFPTDWNDGQSGDPTKGKITVGGVSTNVYTLATIPAKDARVAGPFLWEPPMPTSATEIEPEPDGKKRGHFCLLTRLDCAADPITFPGGSQSTVWNDNNIGMKNLWVVEPDMTFPLTFQPLRKMGKRRESMKVVIDARRLPRNMEMWVAIPYDAIDLKAVKSHGFTIVERVEDHLRALVQPSKRHVIELALNKNVLVHCSFERNHKSPSRGRQGSGLAPVEVSQYYGNQCIGGATFLVKI